MFLSIGVYVLTNESNALTLIPLNSTPVFKMLINRYISILRSPRLHDIKEGQSAVYYWM